MLAEPARPGTEPFHIYLAAPLPPGPGRSTGTSRHHGRRQRCQGGSFLSIGPPRVLRERISPSMTSSDAALGVAGRALGGGPAAGHHPARTPRPAADGPRPPRAADGPPGGEWQHEEEPDDVGNEPRRQEQHSPDQDEGRVGQLSRRHPARGEGHLQRLPRPSTLVPHQPRAECGLGEKQEEGRPAADRLAHGDDDEDLEQRHDEQQHDEQQLPAAPPGGTRTGAGAVATDGAMRPPAVGPGRSGRGRAARRRGASRTTW